MLDKSLIGLLATAVLLLAPGGARAFDKSKYPDLKGQWERVGAPRWLTPGQKAPLTPEYQAVNEAQLADQAAGGQGNWPASFCIPQGMPAIMNLYDPMEIVVTQDTTYILINHVDHDRRIFTDGRDWPKAMEPTYAGYSIGKWIDNERQGRYDVLEVETRNPSRGRAPTTATGLPLHHDNRASSRSASISTRPIATSCTTTSP